MDGVRYILLDLDGTLTDPKEGITKSIQHALTKLNQNPPSCDDLEWTIGPPLVEVFADLLNTKNQDIIQQAIGYYRERYESCCAIENKLYDGIQYSLNQLTSHGYRLYLCTSKPWKYATKILKHFNLDSYFTAIHGSELDGTRDYKHDLIAYIIDQHSLNNSHIVMIGDRHFDIVGAKRNNVRIIAVSYGYGSLQELEAEDPDLICHDHNEFVKILINSLISA